MESIAKETRAAPTMGGYCLKCHKLLDDDEWHTTLSLLPGQRLCVIRAWRIADDNDYAPHQADLVRRILDQHAIIPLIEHARGNAKIDFNITVKGDADMVCIKWQVQADENTCKYSLSAMDGGDVLLQGWVFFEGRPCLFASDAPLVLRPLIVALQNIIPRVMTMSKITRPVCLPPVCYHYDDHYACQTSLDAYAMTMCNLLPTNTWVIGGLLVGNIGTDTSSPLHYLRELFMRPDGNP